MVRHYGPRAGKKIARAGVISKASPSRHQVSIRCCCQCCDRGPARGETLKIGLYRRYSGLLQHNLGQPDAVGPVWIGQRQWLSGWIAPR